MGRFRPPIEVTRRVSGWLGPCRQARPRDVNVREVLNAIFYVLSTGCQWKALPPKNTTHYYFMLWDWDGMLERIHHALYVAAREQAGRKASRPRQSSTAKAAKRLKKGSALDPQGFDAGKKVTDDSCYSSCSSIFLARQLDESREMQVDTQRG
jgi:transposase